MGLGSFYNVGPWEGGTPFVGLATKSCYPLSLLSGPEIFLHCVLVKTLSSASWMPLMTMKGFYLGGLFTEKYPTFLVGGTHSATLSAKTVQSSDADARSI